MSDRSIVMIGEPNSGKTNYLARLWASLRESLGLLTAPDAPPDIKYVEDALSHLLQGHFAPRSETNTDYVGQGISIVVRPRGKTGPDTRLLIPDVSGELWKAAIDSGEIPSSWLEKVRDASGALLFVRVGSEQNVAPLDWVTSAQLLSMPVMGDSGEDTRSVSTQVCLCEFLRFLEKTLRRDAGVPRVAILVTAWDRLDEHRAALGPTAYLSSEYPMLAGRIADISTLDVRVYGVSVVGGDFIDEQFSQQFSAMEFSDAGYVVDDGLIKVADVTLPIAWAVGGSDS
jgi:hypothetical protein